jgi:hypothetical protein
MEHLLSKREESNTIDIYLPQLSPLLLHKPNLQKRNPQRETQSQLVEDY